MMIILRCRCVFAVSSRVCRGKGLIVSSRCSLAPSGFLSVANLWIIYEYAIIIENFFLYMRNFFLCSARSGPFAPLSGTESVVRSVSEIARAMHI